MSPEERVLTQLTREARAEPVPTVDWRSLESELMQRISALPPRRTPRRWVGVALAAFVFGLALVAVLALYPAGESPRSSAGLGASAAVLDGDTLTVGALVRAPDSPVEVVHHGRARWTLSRGGLAHVAAAGRHLTIALDAGSVRAEVLPSGYPESFAIEAGEQRVAVRGTRFEVTLGEDGVRVLVTEGAVVVGERGHPGETTGAVLRAPDARDFSLGAAPRDVAPPASPSTEPRAIASAGSGGRRAAAARAPRLSLETPSALELASLGNRLAAATRSCFVTATPELTEGRVIVESALSFRVLPEGKLADVQFAPSLAPAVEACTRAAAAGLSGPRSRHGGTSSVGIRLER